MSVRTTIVNSYNTRVTNVAGTTASVQLYTSAYGASPPANSVASGAILGRTIWNNSTAVLTIMAGTQAQLDAGRGTVAIAAGGYYEVPFGYVGEVWGKWPAANGFAEMSEVY